MSEEVDTLPPPSSDNVVVAGKYRLTRLIGRGGMGTVWEGVHVSLGTRVAVKLIDAAQALSRDSWRRFENEARAAARLQSKHVVEVYDHGVLDDRRPFIVMQYLQGEPLDRRLERLLVLSPQETARVVLQIGRALTKAHALGIVHRDLKPENIFLVRDEEDGSDVVKVVDFGIAKFAEGSVEAAGTRTGSVLGTPFYMSPEQARGLRTVDHRSDIWSLGVIAFRCMLGELPFQGEATGDVLINVCTGPIPVPSKIVQGVPVGFDAWIERALARDLSARFSSAAEAAESLAAICGITVRPAYSTGDIPVRDFGDAESSANVVVTPGYPSGAASLSPTLPSRDSAAPQPRPPSPPPSPGATGGPLTNTPAPLARKSTSSTAVGLVLFALVLGAGAVALVESRTSPATRSEPSVPSVAPSHAPAVLATTAPTSDPSPATATANEPSAPSATASAAQSAAASSSAREARPRVPSRVRAQKAIPASSSKVAPSLDIRLQR